MFNIICALKHEARPIIDYFRLTHDGSAREFTTYNNELISITITGVGKLASAEGTRFAINHHGASEYVMFLNIGIAGHNSLATGTPVLASKITDLSTGQVWKPRMQIQTDLHTLPLLTVDNPLQEYPEHGMVDMEASGFFSVAPLDRAQCLKIISDNTLCPSKNINKQMVKKLVSDNLAVIEKLLSQLCCSQAHTTNATS